MLFKLNLNRTMFSIVGAIMLLFVSVHLVGAVPAEGIPQQYKQPNGVVFEVIEQGDEWSNWVSADGFTIIKNDTNGYWYYAEKESAQSLKASDMRVGIDYPFGLERGLHEAVVEPLAVMPFGARIAPSVHGGVFGSQPVLVILADFTPSTSVGTTAALWSGRFFDDSVGAKSVKNFYDEASYNQFSIDPIDETQGTINDGIVEVTLGYAHPNTANVTGADNRMIVRDALLAADAFIDFSAYDLDSSGGLDVSELHLFVIPRGYERAFSAACSPSVWGHRWSLFASSGSSGDYPGPTLDTVRVGDFNFGGGYMQFGEWHSSNSTNCSGSGNLATIGIMAHELGHDIAWPDLYDTGSAVATRGSGIGYWSIMSSGSWARESGEPSGTTPTLPDPFSKWYQGWLTPTLVTDDMTGVSLPPSATTPTVFQVLPNPNGVDWDFNRSAGTGEYFLIENRQQIGFDKGLARINSNAEGCVIWHIDETVTSGNSNNNDESNKHVDIEEANSIQDLDLSSSSSSNRGDLDDVWPGSNGYTTFDGNSTPNNSLYNSTDDPGFSINNISATGSGCNFDVDLEQSDLTIDKTDNTLVVGRASTTIYELDYENDSAWDAENVVLTEVVPFSSTFTTAGSTSGWSCLPDNSEGSVCTLLIGTLGANATGTANFAVFASLGGAGVTLQNTATITGSTSINSGVDGDATNNSASDNDTEIQGGLALAVRVSEVSAETDTPYLPLIMTAASVAVVTSVLTLRLAHSTSKRRQ